MGRIPPPLPLPLQPGAGVTEIGISKSTTKAVLVALAITLAILLTIIWVSLEYRRTNPPSHQHVTCYESGRVIFRDDVIYDPFGEGLTLASTGQKLELPQDGCVWLAEE